MVSGKSHGAGSDRLKHLMLTAVVLWGCCPALAEPIPLPYKSRGPYIPVVDLLGGGKRGLVLSAEEADSGRAAPLTIGNTTFYPLVRRGGQAYGGYTSVNGDLQILQGDLYLNNQAVGATLRQLQQQNADQQVQLDQHEGRLNTLSSDAAKTQASLVQTQQSLTQAQQGISQNQAAIDQNQQSIQLLQQSVGTLGQTSTQHAAALSQHAEAIQQLATEMGQAQQDIKRIDGTITNLGSGVAGATALAAALASLPSPSEQGPLACGIGSGGYSDRYALAMGCSLTVTTALSLNAGGAYLFGGSSSYGSGSLSNVAGRFGLAYHFGTSRSNAVRISQSNQSMEQQIEAISAENAALKRLVAKLNERLDRMQDTADARRIR